MLLNAERATGKGVGVKEKNISQAKSTRGQNIYEKKHPYSLSSIGSKPTKNFKNKKEKKKRKEKHTQSEPKNKFTC